jgi:hypothetical protein
MQRSFLALAGAATLALSAALLPAREAGATDIALPWTLAEFVMIFPEAPIELFNDIDTDGDGEISEAELDAAVAAGLIEDPRS